jgi:nucleotide-binding universal stress UspA family protein
VSHANLIMVPTQGLGVYRRLILGSTSAKVLHDADCPVWTGVHLENAPPLEALACQRIVCAVDLKPASERVLDWAGHLAEEYQAELTVVHVTPSNQEACAGAWRERLRDSARFPASVRVEAGEAAKVIPQLAGDLKADLIVIGRKAEPGVLGRLDMTAYSIIRQSHCPVVSV